MGRDFSLREQHPDWKRMAGAEAIDQSRNFMGQFQESPQLRERCLLGVMAFYHYLARYKFFVAQDLSFTLQLLRLTDALVSGLHPEQLNAWNGMGKPNNGVDRVAENP